MSVVLVKGVIKEGTKISKLFCKYPDDSEKDGWYRKETVMLNINKGIVHETVPESGVGAKIVPILTTEADDTETNNLGNVKEFFTGD